MIVRMFGWKKLNHKVISREVDLFQITIRKNILFLFKFRFDQRSILAVIVKLSVPLSSL